MMTIGRIGGKLLLAALLVAALYGGTWTAVSRMADAREKNPEVVPLEPSMAVLDEPGYVKIVMTDGSERRLPLHTPDGDRVTTTQPDEVP